LNSFLFAVGITSETFQLAVVVEKRLFVNFGQDVVLVGFHKLKQQLCLILLIFWPNFSTWRWLRRTNFV
jgi:hypothetical protein